MERFEAFTSGFLKEVKEIKFNDELSDLYCRNYWEMDAGRLLRNESSPSVKTYFKFSVATGKCPVEFMILLLKKFIDPGKLILFIRSTFNYYEPC